MSIQRRLSCLVAGLLLVGTVGFVTIEGWRLTDAMYMTIITLSTVGYGEVQELTRGGRLFASVLICLSLVLMACWTGGITSFLISGELSGRFGRQRTLKMISQMNNHVVICGGGVTARTLITHLLSQGESVVAITDDPAEMSAIGHLSPDILVIEDDPKSELALIDANILAADHLVAATESDYDNLLITITGKGLGTDIRIISFAQSQELASRMTKVGANDVICPLVIGGEHAAKLIQVPA